MKPGSTHQTYATVPLVIFIDRRLAHGRTEHRESSLVHKLARLVNNVVSHRTRIHQNNRLLVRRLHKALNFRQHVLLGLRVVFRRCGIQRLREPTRRNLHVRDIGGESEVYGTRGTDASDEDTVDLGGGGLFIHELRLGDGELFCRFLVRIEPLVRR